jgi:hypothetical protein
MTSLIFRARSHSVLNGLSSRLPRLAVEETNCLWQVEGRGEAGKITTDARPGGPVATTSAQPGRVCVRTNKTQTFVREPGRTADRLRSG